MTKKFVLKTYVTSILSVTGQVNECKIGHEVIISTNIRCLETKQFQG